MADVYEVEHLQLRSRFAAKVLRAPNSDERAARRFQREARLLAGLRSDHIVTVFDVSCPRDERAFYVMELLHGRDLRRLMNETGVISLRRAAKLVSDACAGLAVAHAAALVHRDMKPENLFVTSRDSGEEVCKILDFGVAKVDAGSSTRDGALIGTLRYMAPEQISHPTSVGVRADVYALGAILYECLVGGPTHSAHSVERLLFQVLNEPITPVRARRGDVPEELEHVVLRALERDPLHRFPSVEALADALRPFLFAPSAIEVTSPVHVDDEGGPRAPHYYGKPARRLAVTTVLAGVLATGALLTGSDSGAKQSGRPRPVSILPVTTGSTPAPKAPFGTRVPANTEALPLAPPSTTSRAAPKSRPALEVPRVRSRRRDPERVDTRAIGRVDVRNPYDG
jgi:serine/threonine protein kinase